MGDSFRVERRACATPGCDNLLVFFTDAQSVTVDGEQARATCPTCNAATVLERREPRSA
jgi:hypothetical protein